MRIEKKLKEEVKKMNERILADGEELKQTLIRDYCITTENSKKKQTSFKNKSVIIICCVLVCMLAVGIILPIILKDDGPIHYLKENEINSETTLKAICEATDVQINEQNFNVSLPKVIQDSVSNDILFYSIQAESVQLFPIGTINFITNNRYELVSNEYNKTCIWKESNVMYRMVPSDMNGLPTIQVDGYFEYSNIRIYFSYTDIDLGESVTPVNFLDSLIIN